MCFHSRAGGVIPPLLSRNPGENMKEKLHCTKAPRQYGIQEIWVCNSAYSPLLNCTGLGWLLAIATTRDMALTASSPRRRDNPAPRSRGRGLKAIGLALRENAPGIHFFKTATHNQATVLATFGHQYCLCPPPPHYVAWAPLVLSAALRCCRPALPGAGGRANMSKLSLAAKLSSIT